MHNTCQKWFVFGKLSKSFRVIMSMAEPPSSEEAASENILHGPEVNISEDYGGLGVHYLSTLYDHLNKIHQIDTVTGVTESNGSVRTRAIQVACELKLLGLVEDDIVVICSRAHADQTIVVLASLLLGCTVAPLDSNMSHKDLLNCVKQLHPKICFCDMRPLKQLERVISETGKTVTMIHFGEQTSFAAPFQKFLINKHIQDFKPVVIGEPRKKMAFILISQGTLTNPKLVSVSHHFIYTQTLIMLQYLRNPEKIMTYYPLCWIMQVVIMCACFEGKIVRVLTGHFSERAACKFIHDLKVDYLFLTTTLAMNLIDDSAVRDFNLSSLACVFIGSVNTSVQNVLRLEARFPRIHFTQMYFASETGAVCGCLPKDYRESLNKLNTVGKVVQNTKIRVVDVKTRKDVGPDEPGELLVAGDCLMMGYFKDASATEHSQQDRNYFKTGDLVKYDEAGWIFIIGKLADLMLIEGTLVSPRDIEDVILQYRYIINAAVMCNKNEIIAFVLVKEDVQLDDEDFEMFLSTRLPAHKWPNKIVTIDSFPTTSLGKIKKLIIRQTYIDIQVERTQSIVLSKRKLNQN